MRIFPGMTFVQKLIGLSRSTMRKIALVVAATQIMLGTAPLTESEVRSTSAHVEAAGVDLHHAHSEETCIACVAFKAFGDAQPTNRSAPFALQRIRVTVALADGFDSRLANDLARSRAPPTALLA
jgi:hypothetical protein